MSWFLGERILIMGKVVDEVMATVDEMGVVAE